jgi:uncharacterized membrane protein
MLHYLKSTLLGGILFVLPVLVVLVVVRHAVQITASALRPLAHLLPAEKMAGVVAADVLAIVTIVLLCFLAGLFVGTRIGRRLSERLEQIVLRKVPGYTLFKGAAYGMAGLDAKGELKVALAWIEEAWVLAFVVEWHPEGLSTVFVPSVPTPAAGAIYFLPVGRLQLLDVPVSSAMACVMRLGVGSRELLKQAGWTDPAAFEPAAVPSGEQPA